MYVLADVEWVENDQGLISFTQIAMFRVDEKMETGSVQIEKNSPEGFLFPSMGSYGIHRRHQGRLPVCTVLFTSL